MSVTHSTVDARLHAARLGAHGAGGRRDALGIGVIACVGALLSLASTGFRLGSIDNIFHLPILGSLYDDPQFATDVFIQSLRHFSAGPWQALDGVASHVSPYWLLLALAFVSRVLTFVSFLCCASLLGVRSLRQRAIFAALLAATGLMKGISAAGGGALFVPDFSHTEIANGAMLLALYCAATGRVGVALAAVGATFFCNAFMGVWTVVPVLAIFGLELRRGELTLRPALRQGVGGAAAALAFAAPVVLNVVQNPEFGLSPPVDYRAFLTFYWPQHFLFGSIPTAEALGLAVVAGLAVVSLRASGSRADAFQAALAGFCAVYVLGVVAPLVTASPAVLNLHLLRAGVAIHVLAALGALALAARWATSDDLWLARVAAPALVACCLFEETIAFAPVLIYAVTLPGVRRLTAPLGATPWLRVAACAAVIAVVARDARAASEQSATFGAAVAEWGKIGAWAKANTPPHEIVLTPTYALQQSPQRDAHEAAIAWASYTSGTFEHVARRRVWVDFKRGAAVMWTPSYYALWRARIDAVLDLRSLAERRAYAAENGIGHVIDVCRPTDEVTPVFRTKHLCVFGAAEASAH